MRRSLISCILIVYSNDMHMAQPMSPLIYRLHTDLSDEMLLASYRISYDACCIDVMQNCAFATGLTLRARMGSHTTPLQPLHLPS